MAKVLTGAAVWVIVTFMDSINTREQAMAGDVRFLVEWVNGQPVVNRHVVILSTRHPAAWQVKDPATGEVFKVIPQNLR